MGHIPQSGHGLQITNTPPPSDLSPDARTLYTSDSVIDLLGYTPDEIVNRSCWDFFSQDEVPYARKYQQAKVSMDKAAVLAYCSVRNKEGDYIGCECCFTICYDVMIVCTSIYQRGDNSQSECRWEWVLTSEADDFTQNELSRHLLYGGSSHHRHRTLDTTCFRISRPNLHSHTSHKRMNLARRCF